MGLYETSTNNKDGRSPYRGDPLIMEGQVHLALRAQGDGTKQIPTTPDTEE